MKKPNIAKWLDGFVLACKGILLASKEKRFWIGFLISFLFFGTLINLLSGGFSSFQLMAAVGFPRGLKIIWDAFIGIFGVNMIFSEWIYMFFISLLQSTLIGLIVLLWKKKRGENSANVEKAGIISGLIALGAGCPTCGTTLITPLIGAIFSTGSLAISGAISIIITILAIIIAILSLRRIGEETYVIIKNEKFLQKKEVHAKSS